MHAFVYIPYNKLWGHFKIIGCLLEDWLLTANLTGYFYVPFGTPEKQSSVMPGHTVWHSSTLTNVHACVCV